MKILFTLLFILIVNTQLTFAYTTSNPNDPNIRAKCRNGKYSTSTGRGTCSRNGGVAHYLTKPKIVEPEKPQVNLKNKSKKDD